MQTSLQILLCSILILAQSCSGGHTVQRSSATEQSTDSENVSAQSVDKPVDESEGTPGYAGAKRPVPITGTNLQEVLVSVNCVVNKGSTVPCTDVRLAGKIKYVSKSEARIAKDTIAALGIETVLWTIPEQGNLNCLANDGAYAFYPKCTSRDGSSLEKTVIKATLTLKGTDGTVFAGESPTSHPGKGSFYGNFMLLEPEAGLTPTGKSAYGAPVVNADVQLFTQIWAVLPNSMSLYADDFKNFSYVSNILYSGSISGSIHWSYAVDMCAKKLNSGDGVGKWRLPTIRELCGTGHSSENCTGGLAIHGIQSVPFEGGDWLPFIWSDYQGTAGESSMVGTANMISRTFHFVGAISPEPSIICVR